MFVTKLHLEVYYSNTNSFILQYGQKSLRAAEDNRNSLSLSNQAAQSHDERKLPLLWRIFSAGAQNKTVCFHT